ncbi:bifunctional hydroxymethylpyrimidine kinase/phosphomethylpyrimidine kinase [Marinomonas agarivorans]|nr:bifunctional hydroxymethylpyrimidine kinase/phosphomethylpyrimidine kinase [Marinomonas agarivorans]
MQILKSQTNSYPIALTIAGSDSGGAAGIQADIKTMSATGSYACSAVTALTAQNTLGVDAIMAVEPDFVTAQLDSVFSDLNIQAVKIGMLANTEIIEAVAQSLIKYQPKYTVLDPVMVATSGDLLLDTNSINALITHLLPMANVITPNVHEALVLLGYPQSKFPINQKQCSLLAQKLLQLNCKNVLLKGGHLSSMDSTDILCNEYESLSFSATRIQSKNTHGSGCSLASALTSYLAQGYDLKAAITLAKHYVWHAIAASNELNVGQGSGPLHHFYNPETKQKHEILVTKNRSVCIG